MEKVENFFKKDKKREKSGRLRRKIGALVLSTLASLGGGAPIEASELSFGRHSTVATETSTNKDPLGNQWERAEGETEVNWYIHELAKAKDTSIIQYTLDHYGEWKHQWLSQYIAWFLGRRAYEFKDELTPAQKEQLTEIAADFFKEENLRLEKTCGIDPWNSCSEDFIGQAMKYSLRSLEIFKDAVQLAGGEKKLAELERKYILLSFTDENGNFSLVRQVSPIDNKEHLLLLNHGMQNPPYAAKLLIHLNNALQTHLEGGRPIPDFYYKDPKITSGIKEIFEWLQISALPDGSAFLPTGCLNFRGENGACNDPGFSESIPLFVPGGRVVEILFGRKIFKEGAWPFLEGDSSWNGGDSSNEGRKLAYHTYNPKLLNESLNPRAYFDKAKLIVEWDNFQGATSYDVLGPNGLVARINETPSSVLSYTFYNPPPGEFVFFVIPRAGENDFERILGVSLGATEIPRIPRPHLKKGGS